ncbi:MULTISPECIES: metallophosphoesterase [Clostridium]|uniref:Metallophosphoesterase n=1 Tax=Clostridium cibarium TaxID=2762247 RepID=A0ABR8PWJ0_9CLOT|nr:MULTISPECIES: metallophosphoesterase [Clostridium]MBD7912529.1 metallophosphoesterase [Clostridium cibarium]
MLAFIIISILYFLLSFLVGNRIYKSINKVNKLNKIVYWCIFAFISSSFIIYETATYNLPSILNKVLAFISSYYLAFFAYILMLFPIAFILTKLLKPKNNKLDFYMISLLITTLIVGIGTFLANSPYVKEYTISTDKQLKDGKLKIALVSDLHLGYFRGNNRIDLLKSELNKLGADVVIIAGDLVDGNLDPIIEDNMFSHLKDIKSTYGTYFATGNHDFYTGKVDELCTLLTEQGIHILRNESTLINDEFYILGRDDVTADRLGTKRPPLDNMSSNIDNNKFSILIDHNPQNIKEAEGDNIDLQVSGHTHKGQIIPGNLITHAIFPLDYGYGKFGNTNLVVSSGYGLWGPPIRTGSRSEIVLITLSNK